MRRRRQQEYEVERAATHSLDRRYASNEINCRETPILQSVNRMVNEHVRACGVL